MPSPTLRQTLQAAIRQENLLGEGTAHSVYRIDAPGYEDFVLRVPKLERVRRVAGLRRLVAGTALGSGQEEVQRALFGQARQFQMRDHGFGAHNFGQPLAEWSAGEVDILLRQPGRSIARIMEDAKESIPPEKLRANPFAPQTEPALAVLQALQKMDDPAFLHFMEDLNRLSLQRIGLAADAANIHLSRSRIHLLDIIDANHAGGLPASETNTAYGVVHEFARMLGVSPQWHKAPRAMNGYEEANASQRAFNGFMRRVYRLARENGFPMDSGQWHARFDQLEMAGPSKASKLSLEAESGHAARILAEQRTRQQGLG